MGNCLGNQHKVVRIMKMNGELLEYQTPIKVQEVLSEFKGHAISDALPVQRHLCLTNEMVGGHMYYLLPPPLPSNKVEKRELNITSMSKEGANVVRVKLVISKQELREMLSKGGISVDKMLSQLQRQQSEEESDDDRSCRGWKPELQSIPE